MELEGGFIMVSGALFSGRVELSRRGEEQEWNQWWPSLLDAILLAEPCSKITSTDLRSPIGGLAPYLGEEGKHPLPPRCLLWLPWHL